MASSVMRCRQLARARAEAEEGIGRMDGLLAIAERQGNTDKARALQAKRAELVDRERSCREAYAREGCGTL